MKLFSSYIKELKIAARGFYFYIEIFSAVVILLILLLGVKEDSISKNKEFLFYNMSSEMKNSILQKDIDNGILVLDQPTDFKMKTLEFEVNRLDSNTNKMYKFDKDIYSLETYKMYNKKTGKLDRTIYLASNEEELIRLSFQEKTLGATITVNSMGESSFRYYTQGYETKKYIDLIQILHNEAPEVLEQALNRQVVKKLTNVETLNARENLVPIMVVFMGSLMGFFIVMAYIFLDKDEGVIKAFVVTPAPVWTYLLSKTLVIITTVLFSSSIITIPIMGLKANYLLFYPLLSISTFTFASFGLFISSFFSSISKSFGILYSFMVAMMIPAFAYFVPSFDPLWLRFFPTYPMIQSFREIIMVEPNIDYVLITAAFFLLGGFLLFILSNYRFKKTLTV